MILPFPGGVVRSGSKVGARGYKGMIASTNDAYCPTLRPLTASALPDGVNSVLEIVLDGLSPDAIRGAMRAGIDAACRPGVRAISAGNYGGKLGPHHFHLRADHGRAGVSDAVVLTLRAPLDGPLDLSGVTPDRCAALSRERDRGAAGVGRAPPRPRSASLRRARRARAAPRDRGRSARRARSRRGHGGGEVVSPRRRRP